uniref:Uncharacterized protein n=1 Tax=Arundo donax TaxID=35708 RepID=A0A0A8ZR06_ARUDO
MSSGDGAKPVAETRRAKAPLTRSCCSKKSIPSTTLTLSSKASSWYCSPPGPTRRR